MVFKKSHLIVLILALTVAVGLISLTQANAQDKAKAGGPTRVAVCSLSKVIPEYERAKDATVKLIGWAGNMTMSNARLQGVITT